MALVMYDLCGIDESLRFSPFCWRAKLAIAHKGLEVEARPWCFTEKEKLEFTEHDKVPVLIDGDEVITDSFEILRYLDRAYPEAPTLLGGPLAESRARFFKHYSERALQLPILRTIVMDLMNAIHPKDRDYFRTTREKRLGMTLEQFHSPAKGLSQLDSALEPLRGQLSGSDFIDGDAPGAADYLVFANFMWARSVSTADLVSNADPVYAWIERMLDANGGVGRNAVRICDIEGAYRA